MAKTCFGWERRKLSFVFPRRLVLRMSRSSPWLPVLSLVGRLVTGGTGPVPFMFVDAITRICMETLVYDGESIQEICTYGPEEEGIPFYTTIICALRTTGTRGCLVLMDLTEIWHIWTEVERVELNQSGEFYSLLLYIQSIDSLRITLKNVYEEAQSMMSKHGLLDWWFLQETENP